MQLCATFLFILLSTSIILAQEGYPVPEHTPDQLFYIQHSNNHNTYVYDLNRSNDELNSKKPIHVYRIQYTQGGVHKPLNALQRNFAYGLILDATDSTKFQFHLAATKQIEFFLTNNCAKPYVYVNVNGRKIKLNRMFIQIKSNTSGLTTLAEYVLFYGRDLSSGSDVIEKYVLN